jgi:hypothetical protein
MSSRSISVAIGATIVAAALSACSSVPWECPIKGGPTETGAGTLAAARKYLEGRWSLVSYEVFPLDGPPITLKGTGILTFDEFGNLTVDIRPDKPSTVLLEKAGIQTPNGTLLTSGRAAVDMQARTLTYVIQGEPPLGAPSGPLALNRPRHWEVEGNLLTLTIKGDDGRPVSVGRWQKPEQAPQD